MNEAKAQRKWEARNAEKVRRMDKCARCGYLRWTHNRGNRFMDDDICKLFKEQS